ncbi:MAG TPA: sensor histidine kinase [Peptococcaceae bacterium]|nr:sensor histidine kinase [Peptococcaceae bacterium]
MPQKLSISETELCALLSNSLENAIEAAAKVTDEQLRKIRISCHIHKGNLLIFIENNFTGELQWRTACRKAAGMIMVLVLKA